MDAQEQQHGGGKCSHHCEECHCWSGMGWCQDGHWKHAILKALIALFIFWAGMQFGALRGAYHMNTGYYGYGSNQMYYSPMGSMMPWRY